VCLLTAVSVFAQSAPTEKKTYQNIVVEKFTIREGVEFPADKIDSLTKSVQSTLTKSNRFQHVDLGGAEATTESMDAPTLKITGEIIKYVKGNRAARYMVGFGVGATKIITDVKFIDAKTGEVVHQQTVDGDVTWGFFGGDSDDAKSGVADEIIRVMKKNKFAGDKIKKTK
jgi:curli biogenesis system outer membrane secretion channel CsgG